MKQGKSLISFVVVLMSLATLTFLVAGLFSRYYTTYSTTYPYHYTANQSTMQSAYLVREETVLPLQSGILEVRRGEGEKVPKGGEIARTYRDESALQTQQNMQNLETTQKILSLATADTGEGVSSARLDADVLADLMSLRTSVGGQDFSRLEDQIIQLKSAVLKREYTYSPNLSLSFLTAQLQTVNQQISLAKTQNSVAASTITAPFSGTYSSFVDGFETTLTPASIQTLSPRDIAALPKQASQEGQTAGKLIAGTRWFLLSTLPAEAAASLSTGQSLQVRFGGEFSRTISMRIDRIDPPEDGICAITLSCDRFLAETTSLRYTTVELIYESYSGLRIPKTALRMRTITVPLDPKDENSPTEQRDLLGVYVLSAGKAEFKQVNLVYTGDTYYLVTPIDPTASKTLRADDLIIVHATELYHGKILDDTPQ